MSNSDYSVFGVFHCYTQGFIKIKDADILSPERGDDDDENEINFKLDKNREPIWTDKLLLSKFSKEIKIHQND